MNSANATRLYVIAYDITSDRRRRRLSKRLEDFGVRSQKSVFVFQLPPNRLDGLWNDIRETIDEDEDAVACYHLCARCATHVRSIGIAAAPRKDPEYYMD